MLKVADIALTGISTNILKLDAASNNITNVNTPDYKAIRVPTVEENEGGTRGVPIRDTRDGNLIIHSDTGKIEESSNTNLAVEFTNLMAAQRSVQANVNVIRTSDELLGTLFDIKA
jgi:flagellar hook protein FlgE